MNEIGESQDVFGEFLGGATDDATMFLLWGLNAVVYVRQVDFEGIELFGVFSADGTQVAVAHSRNEAIGWALAKDLETPNVH